MEPASAGDSLDLSVLSPSEREVLERARSGSTAIEIAQQLALSEATVRTHLSHVYQKLGVRGRVELLARLHGSAGTPTIAPPLQAATNQTPVGLVAVLAGSAVAVVGLGLYQAWWTLAFAFGGFAVALFSQRQLAPLRSIAIGAAISGSLLLTGMSVLMMFGTRFGSTVWLVASLASLVTTIALLLFARRQLRHRPTA